MRLTLPSSLAVMALALAACSSPAATTSAPSVSSPAARTPAAVSSPTAAGAAGTPTAARPAGSPATGTPATGTQAGIIRLTVAQGSEVRYRAREQLAQRPAPNDAVGKTSSVSGAIVIGADGKPVKDQSKITVQMNTLASDSGQRDNFVRGTTLEVNRFPTADFVVTDIRNLANPMPTSGEATFDLIGDLTLHGVTKQVTFPVKATFSANDVKGSTSTKISFADYGMSKPQVPVVLSIEEPITLEMDLTLTRGGV